MSDPVDNHRHGEYSDVFFEILLIPLHSDKYGCFEK
jgi:hypothetical protein